MKKSFFKKSWLWLLMTIMSFGPGYGQLTSTSGQEDSLLIRQFVENSHAIMDSLIRYEYAKIRLAMYSSTNTECQKILRQNGNQIILLAGQLKNSQAIGEGYRKQALHWEKRFVKASKERWVYRAALATGVFFVLRSVMLPP